MIMHPVTRHTSLPGFIASVAFKSSDINPYPDTGVVVEFTVITMWYHIPMSCNTHVTCVLHCAVCVCVKERATERERESAPVSVCVRKERECV